MSAVMIDRLTCILCPVGCDLEVQVMRDGEESEELEERVEVRGHQCDKGPVFAAGEVLRPLRNLATSVPAEGTEATMVSVRLNAAVPRERIFPILAEIARLRPALPVRRGDVLLPDVLGTGVDVIATRTVLD